MELLYYSLLFNLIFATEYLQYLGIIIVTLADSHMVRVSLWLAEYIKEAR